MDLLAVWLGKLTLAALRLLGRRGNALPGLVVEKVFPGYLARAMRRLPEGVVVVSGTNGKTTTTKMVATVLGRRYRVLTNDTGSNFVRGAITATVEHARWSGRLPFDVAVFELDEAWAVRFVERVAPRRSLLLNVMRDQLDRFGEIDTTAALLGKVAAATTGHVVLNRDDNRIAALAATTSAAVSYYGVAPELRPAFPTDEELYGGPVGSSAVPAEVELLRLGARDEPMRMRIGTEEFDIALRAEGPHNAQNAAGAAATALTFALAPSEVAAGLAEVSPAFGRGQRFRVDGRDVVLQLVKNPAGFRQTLHTLDDGSPADSRGHRHQRRLRGRPRRVVVVGRRLQRAGRTAPDGSPRRVPGRQTWRCACVTTTCAPTTWKPIRRRRSALPWRQRPRAAR